MRLEIELTLTIGVRPQRRVASSVSLAKGTHKMVPVTVQITY
jgi:hypothetical protein